MTKQIPSLKKKKKKNPYMGQIAAFLSQENERHIKD